MNNKNYESENLMDLAHELDCEMGSIGCSIITIEDVSTLISHLREDMDNVNHDYLKIAFMDMHRTVRVLDDLTNYVVKELGNDFNKAYEIKRAIFKKAHDEKKPNAFAEEMSREKENQKVMEFNRKSFLAEFGREAESDEEVREWVAAVVAEIDESNQ